MLKMTDLQNWTKMLWNFEDFFCNVAQFLEFLEWRINLGSFLNFFGPTVVLLCSEGTQNRDEMRKSARPIGELVWNNERRKYYSALRMVNNRSCNFIVLLYHCQCFPPDASQFRKRIAAKGIPDSVTIFADRKNGTTVQTDMGITSHSLYIVGDIFCSYFALTFRFSLCW